MSSHTPKGCGVDWPSGPVPWLWVRSAVPVPLGGTLRRFSVTLMFLSLPPFFSLGSCSICAPRASRESQPRPATGLNPEFQPVQGAEGPFAQTLGGGQAARGRCGRGHGRRFCREAVRWELPAEPGAEPSRGSGPDPSGQGPGPPSRWLSLGEGLPACRDWEIDRMFGNSTCPSQARGNISQV